MVSFHRSATGRTIAVALLAAATPLTTTAEDWPRFRGPHGMGVSATSGPTSFSQSENLRWKVELPGPGYSSPIVVGDKVFVTSYSGYGTDDGDAGDIENLKRHMLCIDRNSGEILWQRDLPAEQPEDPYTPPGVSTHGYASHTPVSDGERVYAFFGKSGVVAFDMAGEKLWQTNVGKESGSQRWGSAASPIVVGDSVVVNAADEGQAVVGLDKRTGDEKWRKEAAGLENSWSTPLVVESADGPQVVLAVMGEIWSFDPEDGKFNWFAKGSEGRTVSHSLISSDGVIYSVGESAVAVDAEGGEDAVVWQQEQAGSSFVTPLLLDGRLYYLGRNGVFNCIRAKDGRRVFRARLASGEAVSDEDVAGSGRGRPGRGGPGRGREGAGRGGPGAGGGPGGGGPGRGGRGGYGGANFGRGIDYASPVAGGDKIYIATQSGTIYVVAAGQKFELLSKNDIGDTSGIGATPALTDGDLFIRSNTHLYCFSDS